MSAAAESGMANHMAERLVMNHKRFAVLLIAAIWSILVVSSLYWNVGRVKTGTRDMARIQAGDAFTRDVIYRSWNARQGGIYVPVSDTTPPNPYLDVPERDITTPSGILLTRMNPAYMTRKVHEIARLYYDVHSHITSLNPIRPENKPDEWEAQALQVFKKQGDEVSRIVDIEGAPFMRLMKPLITEAACLKCHAVQGYQQGDIRGGISVAVPMAPFLVVEQAQLATVYTGHGILWLMGLAGLWLGSWLISRQVKNLMTSENRLKKSEALCRELFSTVSDTVILYDTQTYEIVDVNEAACDLLGYTRDELIRLKVDHVSAEPSESKAVIEQQVQGRHLTVPLLYMRKKDGTTIPMSISTGIVKLENRSIGCGIFSDLSYVRKLQAKLIQSERLAATGQLAASVAHEINSPLQAISATLTGLKEDNPGNTSVIQGVDLLRGAFESIRKTVQNLIHLSRPVHQEKRSADMNKIIRQTGALLKKQLKKNRVSLELALARDIPAVRVAPQKMSQVLLNLCNNAVEAFADGDGTGKRQLRIETRHTGQKVVIEVADNGPGIPEADLDRVFDPFYTRKKTMGLGVGLSICHNIVNEYGGRIAAVNGPDRGAVFTIQLPVNPENKEH